MSTSAYYMDDASITVPSGFIDRTVNVLQWPIEGGDNAALVVQRERLPRAASAEAPEAEDLDRYVAAQSKGYAAQFAGFALERDEVATGDSGFEMRRKVFRWRREQAVLYHHQVFVLLGADVLLLTASCKALHREAADLIVEEALRGLRMRGEDERR